MSQNLFQKRSATRKKGQPVRKIPAAKSEGVETLKLHLRADGIAFTVEYKFHPKRKWRFDFIILRYLQYIGVEIDGGIWTQGRHSRGAGMESDMKKLNEAAIMGYKVLRFSTGMVKDGTAIETIRRALE